MKQFEELTNKILKHLKAGVAPWRKPWDAGKSGTKYPTPMDMPKNARTGKHYQGLNITILWLASMEKHFQSPYWGSIKQWEKLGATVLPGHLGQSTSVLFSIRIKWQDRKDLQPNDPKVDKFVFVWHEVYNLSQVAGANHLRTTTQPEVKEEKGIDFVPADTLIEKTKAVVKHGGERAFYSISGDYIQLPLRKRFHSRGGYYTTKLHELVHWTGHPTRKKRFDSKNPKHFDKNSEEYAAEELVAELGSCFLLAHLGLPEHLNEMPHHASYIDHWIRLLQEDDRAIWRAAAKAGAAVTFIVGKPKVQKKRKRTKKQRSQAAKKAWETRRRKQENGLCLSTSL